MQKYYFNTMPIPGIYELSEHYHLVKEGIVCFDNMTLANFRINPDQTRVQTRTRTPTKAELETNPDSYMSFSDNPAGAPEPRGQRGSCPRCPNSAGAARGHEVALFTGKNL